MPTNQLHPDGYLVPPCCPGCKWARNNMCHKPNYCWIYRFFRKIFRYKYHVPNASEYMKG